MSGSVKNVMESFSRCAGKDLVGRFYEIFLKSDPRIPAKFSHTDFQKQKDLLNHGVYLAIMHADGNKMGTQGLTRIRDSHSKVKLNIQPALYAFWKNSFLKALAEIDPQFTDGVRAEWDAVLQKAIDFVASGYEKTPA